MLFDLDMCVGNISNKAIKQISDAFNKRLLETGITRIQWIALYYLKRKELISQRDLSNLMGVKDSSAGRLIDRLERDGYIKRERTKKDRRVILISLTKEGDNLITELMFVGINFKNDLVNDISDEDISIYEKVLSKMVQNVSTE